MNNEQILALIDILVDQKFIDIDIPQGKRGLRGSKGLDGSQGVSGENGLDAIFNWDEYKEQIFLKIQEHSLKFSDLTTDEKFELKGPRGQRGKVGLDGNSFIWNEHEEAIFKKIGENRLKFSDLTDEEKDSLKGSVGLRGLKGRDGKSVEWDDCKEIIFDKIEENKLKFSDLNDEERNSLVGNQGPRGLRGQKGKEGSHGTQGEDGKSFSWEENSEAITNIIKENKFKFEDFSDDEILSLRGSRGLRGFKGKAGINGLTAYEVWAKENKGEESDFLKSLIGKTGVPGISGLNGKDGKDGKNGANGSDGLSAPVIRKVELDKADKNRYRFVFTFDDGSVLRTNFVTLDGNALMQNITSVNSSVTYIPVSDEGVQLTEKAKSFNFVGDLVEATDDGDGNITVTVEAPDTSSIVLKNVDCDTTVYVGSAVRMNISEIAINAIADDIDNSNVLGFVEVKTSTVKCDIRVTGITPENYTGLDVTKTYYLSDTVAGGIQLNVPTTSGHVKLKLGQPFSDKKMVYMKGEPVIRA